MINCRYPTGTTHTECEMRPCYSPGVIARSPRDQPLGSMPRRFNSSRPRVLSQFPKLISEIAAAASNCAFSSGVILTWKAGAFPIPFGCLSRFIGVDMCVPISYDNFQIGTHPNIAEPIKTTPRYCSNSPGRLTTMLLELTLWLISSLHKLTPNLYGAFCRWACRRTALLLPVSAKHDGNIRLAAAWFSLVIGCLWG